MSIAAFSASLDVFDLSTFSMMTHPSVDDHFSWTQESGFAQTSAIATPRCVIVIDSASVPPLTACRGRSWRAQRMTASLRRRREENALVRSCRGRL